MIEKQRGKQQKEGWIEMWKDLQIKKSQMYIDFQEIFFFKEKKLHNIFTCIIYLVEDFYKLVISKYSLYLKYLAVQNFCLFLSMSFSAF